MSKRFALAGRHPAIVEKGERDHGAVFVAYGHVHGPFAVIVQPETGVDQPDVAVAALDGKLVVFHLFDLPAETAEAVLGEAVAIVADFQNEVSLFNMSGNP